MSTRRRAPRAAASCLPTARRDTRAFLVSPLRSRHASAAVELLRSSSARIARAALLERSGVPCFDRRSPRRSARRCPCGAVTGSVDRLHPRRPPPAAPRCDDRSSGGSSAIDRRARSSMAWAAPFPAPAPRRRCRRRRTRRRRAASWRRRSSRRYSAMLPLVVRLAGVAEPRRSARRAAAAPTASRSSGSRSSAAQHDRLQRRRIVGPQRSAAQSAPRARAASPARAGRGTAACPTVSSYKMMPMREDVGARVDGVAADLLRRHVVVLAGDASGPRRAA